MSAPPFLTVLVCTPWYHRAVATAVHSLHRVGLIHADVKASNGTSGRMEVGAQAELAHSSSLWMGRCTHPQFWRSDAAGCCAIWSRAFACAPRQVTRPSPHKCTTQACGLARQKWPPRSPTRQYVASYAVWTDAPRVATHRCTSFRQEYQPSVAYDIWQLGVLAFHLLTGSHLFDGSTDTLACLAKCEPVPEWALHRVEDADPAAAPLVKVRCPW